MIAIADAPAPTPDELDADIAKLDQLRGRMREEITAQENRLAGVQMAIDTLQAHRRAQHREAAMLREEMKR